MPFISNRQERKSRESEEINRLMKAYGLERKRIDINRKANAKRKRSRKPAVENNQAQEDVQTLGFGLSEVSKIVSEEMKKQDHRLDKRLTDFTEEFEENLTTRIQATESRVTVLETQEDEFDGYSLEAKLTDRMNSLDASQVTQEELVSVIENIARQREEDQTFVGSLTNRVIQLEEKNLKNKRQNSMHK